MKTLLVFYVVLNFSSALSAQDLSNNAVEKLLLTYTFHVKQAISLDVIADRFPDLKEEVHIAAHDWNREFKTSIDNIDTLLCRQLKEQWIRDRDAIREKYAIADYSGTSERDAHQFIVAVSERANGKIESPILETLLMYKPAYQQSPELEISDGYSQKFTTQKWNKSLPVNIILVIPKSWNHAASNKKGNVHS